MDEVSRFVAEIQANIRNFERNVKRAQAQATALPDEIDVNVDADISKFRRGLLRAQALAQRFSASEIVKRIVIKPGTFRNMYHAFTANFTEPFNRRMGELADNIRTFGVISGNMIRGALVSAFSALVPIIASVTAAIMALGNSIGVMVGTIGAFVGALGIAGAGAAAYGGLVASVLARYNDEAFQATEASNRFTQALDAIKSTWNGIVDSHMDAIFTQMATGVNTANFALEQMTPFIDGVVSAMGRMTGELQTFVQESPTMLRFFDNMNSKGSEVFDNMVRGIGRFGQGIIDTMNAAMPLIEWVAQGFNNLGTQFSNWASRMAETNGFHDFINYVKETMPLIGQIFGDFFLGVINLFASFGENSQTVLQGLADMMERFREWSSTIKESDGFQKFIQYIQDNGPTVVSLIGNIISTIVNFAIAIAPLASQVLNLANSFFEWLSQLMKTSPIVGMIIGVITTLFGVFQMLAPAIIAISTVLGPLISWFIRLLTNARLVSAIMTVLRGAMVLLSGPVGVVISVLTALSSIFIMLYQNVEWFRNIVNTAWNWITGFIGQQVQTIIGWFNHFRDQGQNIFMSALSAITATLASGLAQGLATIVNWVINAAVQFGLWASNMISTAVSALAQFAANIASGLANAFTAFVSWIANVISSITAFGVNLVSTIISTLAQFASNIASGLVTATTAFINWTSNVIARIITFGINLVTTIVSALVEFGSAILSGLNTAYTNFTTWISNTISAIVSFVSQLVSNIVSGMSSFVSEIASGASNALSEIVSFASSAISEAISFVSSFVSEIASGMADFVSEIVSGGADAVSEVISMGSEIVSSIGDFVSDTVSTGADLIQGLIEGIAGKAKDVVDAAVSVAKDAVNAVKGWLGIASPSRVFRDIGQFTSQGLAVGINKDADRAVNEITRLASDMTDAYRPEFNAINADMDKDINGINGRIRNTVDADITSGIETQRPIVNVTVRNEGDVEMIRSAIQTEDGIEDSLAF
ncbi:phage tail protein [Salinicoccus albus]|uniref:phage tail protein n=1 Tax=Salinicoccus albus TaxID=418756 RepID=UPI0003815431|nr:hypothetical protein [Salinicoccus albus]